MFEIIFFIFRNLVLVGRMLSPLWQCWGAVTIIKTSVSPRTRPSMTMVSVILIILQINDHNHCVMSVVMVIGVLDYSDYGPGRDPFKSLTEKKLKEMVSMVIIDNWNIVWVYPTNCNVVSRLLNSMKQRRIKRRWRIKWSSFRIR